MNTEIYADVERIKSALLEHKREVEKIRSLDRPISLEDPFVISFVGRFKTGKSSLLNALLGADILPTKATTATSVVTRIFKGNTSQAWFVEKGKKQQITLESAQDIILNYRTKDPTHPGEVVLELPIPWLSRDVELRDTPGMDDSAQNGLLEKIALNALTDTDLCICVFDASAMISAKERERTRRIHSRMAGNVVYAINCTNRLNSMKQLQEVDDLCNRFFGSLKREADAVYGAGKYYLMCSAPNMIDLDGFDSWLKLVTSDHSAKNRVAIRKSSLRGLQREKTSEIRVNLLPQIELLKEYRKTLETQQASIRADLRSNADRKHNENETRLRKRIPSLMDTLCDVNTLETRLKSCTTSDGWENRYSGASKNAVNSMFQDNWKKAKVNSGESFFREIGGQFINDTFSVLTFPGRSTTSVSATTGERVGGAAIGAGIGMIFGPIGALIGGAVGHAIGAADTTTDNSVSNTVSYVKREVIPTLRSSFENTVQEKLKKQRNTARSNANNANTGVEPLLSSTKGLIAELNTFLQEMQLS